MVLGLLTHHDNINLKIGRDSPLILLNFNLRGETELTGDDKARCWRPVSGLNLGDIIREGRERIGEG